MSDLECAIEKVQAGDTAARLRFQEEFGAALSLVVRRGLRGRAGASPLNHQIRRMAAELQEPGEDSTEPGDPLVPQICRLLIERMTQERRRISPDRETLRPQMQEMTEF